MDINQLIAGIYNELGKHTVILDGLQNAEPTWMKVMPHIISLLSVIVAFSGAYWSFKMARQQLKASGEQLEKELRANVIATGRREWIENLRKEAANFLHLIDKYRTVISLEKIAQEDKNKDKEIESEELYKEFLPSFEMSKSYIKLMLNIDDDEHLDVLGCIDDIHDLIFGDGMISDTDMRAINDATDKLTELISIVLKSTWEEVKRLS